MSAYYPSSSSSLPTSSPSSSTSYPSSCCCSTFQAHYVCRILHALLLPSSHSNSIFPNTFSFLSKQVIYPAKKNTTCLSSKFGQHDMKCGGTSHMNSWGKVWCSGKSSRPTGRVTRFTPPGATRLHPRPSRTILHLSYFSYTLFSKPPILHVSVVQCAKEFCIF